MPVQPDFSIEARIPEDVDMRKGTAPDWCDLQVIVENDHAPGAKQRLNLTRPAGELLIAAVGEVLHPWAGMSIIEHIWAELDDVMDGLMTGREASAEAKGTALGLATALALMYNPVDPNVDAIREEAMERWDSAHGDDEEMVGAEPRELSDRVDDELYGDDEPVWS